MMRRCAALLFLVAVLPAAADGPKLPEPKLEEPRLELTDGKLPLWELRPLDRRVYVVSLDGDWKKEFKPGATYYLNVRFADGTVYTHRPINESMFFRGEMRFMVPDYLLIRTRTAKGGKLGFFVSERPTAGAKAERISSTLELDWPIKRRVTTRPPDTKFSPPRPIDRFPPTDDDK